VFTESLIIKVQIRPGSSRILPRATRV
jgi:hypothetical protein